MKTTGNQKSEKFSNFWKNRYREIGHTGWKDPIIYAYDQIERLAIISTKLNAIDVWPKVAIDFGCGTGDFSNLLLKKDFVVWGYDPYVSSDVSHPQFKHVTEKQDIDTERVGLILSVTVLDHILEDDAFEAELLFLRNKISEQGVFLMMEYALDESRSKRDRYQAYRTTEDWRKHLEKAGWEIISTELVPHPNVSPSIGFSTYSKCMFVKPLKRLSRINFLYDSSLRILTIYAINVFNKHGIGDVNQSPLKLMTCKPSRI